ncbi:MAG TPA: GAF domain-containing sensor histidine kinase [Methylomusa anaerophila]|uniref:histidine kinase n=1 Tax=Methylomusa anaerophila TaxID=1930071 RepID=A0A348AFX5_9FIRM|nr:GAF domain-containing sensor histidine kinase [Methylomusa anaerophila]BBB89973.1 sporulation kinase E [Methylomusa anaerophila]HML88299.1 GAF domain-containing sensor histidine kinase [Methylomusa anaerophila]
MKIIKRYTKVECVGARFFNDDSYISYEAQIGFAKELWEKESEYSTENSFYYCSNTFKVVDKITEEGKPKFAKRCLEFGYGTVAAIPITYQGKVLGALCLADHQPEKLSAETIYFLEMVAPLIGETFQMFKLELEIARLKQLELVGQMAVSISQEIRNPLTILRSSLEMLSNKSQNKYRDYFELMITEVERIKLIINEFLSFAKENNTLSLANINQIIRSLESFINSQAFKHNVSLYFDLGTTPNIELNKAKIRQLILNLTTNAIEAMPQGGILIVRTYKTDEGVTLLIKDTGAGIPPEILDNIGTPFLTTQPAGTGLGLAVCYSIVSQHNAVMDVKTGKDGTTFIIKFRRHLS